MPQETITVEERRRRMVVALNSARPSHEWAAQLRPGCAKCPDRSPFKLDPATHPYYIEEEL